MITAENFQIRGPKMFIITDNVAYLVCLGHFGWEQGFDIFDRDLAVN